MVRGILPLAPGDLPVIKGQMKGRRFDPSGILGVSRRCPWGYPQVLVCFPLRKDRRPFPTTYWLSCPWLVRILGRLESQGGVQDLERALYPVKSLWIKYHMAHGADRILLLSPSLRKFLRMHRRPLWDALRHGGVGGIDYRNSETPRVKCLHLQVASWLSMGYHPGCAWLRDRIPITACPDGICKSHVPAIHRCADTDGGTHTAVCAHGDGQIIPPFARFQM